jgi:hypothetical protein
MRLSKRRINRKSRRINRKLKSRRLKSRRINRKSNKSRRLRGGATSAQIKERMELLKEGIRQTTPLLDGVKRQLQNTRKQIYELNDKIGQLTDKITNKIKTDKLNTKEKMNKDTTIKRWVTERKNWKQILSDKEREKSALEANEKKFLSQLMTWNTEKTKMLEKPKYNNVGSQRSRSSVVSGRAGARGSSVVSGRNSARPGASVVSGRNSARSGASGPSVKEQIRTVYIDLLESRKFDNNRQIKQEILDFLNTAEAPNDATLYSLVKDKEKAFWTALKNNPDPVRAAAAMAKLSK